MSLGSIFREFLSAHPRPFAVLFAVLTLDALVTSAAVLTLVPLADFLLDPGLRMPSPVTKGALRLLAPLNNQPGFWSFALLFVSVNVIKGVLNVCTRYAILRIKYSVVRGLFGDALRAFFNARWEFFNSANHGRLLNTFNREMNTVGDTLGHLASQLATMLQLAIYLMVPLWLSARITLVALGLAVVLGSPLLLVQKLAYRLGQRNTATANAMMGVLSEILAAARLILGFGRQQHSREKFLNAFDRHIAVTLRSQTVEASASAFFQPIAILAGVTAAGFALQQGMPLAEIAALLWSLLRAFPLLGQMLATNITLNNFLPSYEQLVDLRAKARELKEIEGEIPFALLKKGITLKNVSFTYPGRSHTLQDIDLLIPKGRTTALVGESGAGKSTITDLVLGLQLPSEGEVLIDGVSLTKLKQNTFREKVGYVPQDPLLFHASIRENLLWSQPAATVDDLWRACRMANAESFIRGLPEGLDTVVGDRGMRLSGGQRQRIALARALVRKPELLILDEATSSLDTESELLIQQAIDELAKETTMLVIAHRLSTIARAHNVYVVGGGRIAESGPYAELCAKPRGVLSRMIAVQRSLDPSASDPQIGVAAGDADLTASSSHVLTTVSND